MGTFLAIVGGVFLAIVLLFAIFYISKASLERLKALNMVEHTIRRMWHLSGDIDDDKKDELAITFMKDTFYAAQTFEQYRICLYIVNSISKDIVKKRNTLAEFKKNFVVYGYAKGWATEKELKKYT